VRSLCACISKQAITATAPHDAPWEVSVVGHPLRANISAPVIASVRHKVLACDSTMPNSMREMKTTVRSPLIARIMSTQPSDEGRTDQHQAKAGVDGWVVHFA
jgi:hypothetical protein